MLAAFHGDREVGPHFELAKSAKELLAESQANHRSLGQAQRRPRFTKDISSIG
jgi:hypothetical protein